jgi:Putative bacterial sensory transduction regulator
VNRAGAVEESLRESGVTWRRVASGEWGLTVPAGGWDLQVGLALRGGMLAAQAEVLGPGATSERALLRRNRTLRLVRFSVTAAGAVYVQGELPEAAVDAPEVDRLLGLLVAAAEELRGAAGE